MNARKSNAITTQPPASAVGRFCMVVACNDETALQRNLLASEMAAEGRVPIHIERGAHSAGSAYNRGLEATTAPVVIFAHQDVYFPPGWEQRLTEAITLLEKQDPDWALLAPFGVAGNGDHIGPVWSSSLGQIVGRAPNGCEPVQSFDELVIIVRRGSGLCFDADLPGFHMYGTDIVQSARAQGLGAYIAALPLVHNDMFHDTLHADFARAYHYMRKKWRRVLPVRSSILSITRHGLNLPVQRLLMRASYGKRQAIAQDTNRPPQQYSAICGWE